MQFLINQIVRPQVAVYCARRIMLPIVHPNRTRLSALLLGISSSCGQICGRGHLLAHNLMYQILRPCRYR